MAHSAVALRFCSVRELAAGVAAVLVWLGPPGTDFAAHVYQRILFVRHGFTLLDHLWYAGR